MDYQSSLSDKVPLFRGVSDMDFLDEISNLLDKEDVSSALIKDYINKLKSKKNEIGVVTDEEIRAVILKHPYFKNPCKYPIRLVNVMKHLKKKGLDVSIKDIDLRVDKIIASIDGINRVEYGLYVNCGKSLS